MAVSKIATPNLYANQENHRADALLMERNKQCHSHVSASSGKTRRSKPWRFLSIAAASTVSVDAIDVYSSVAYNRRKLKTRDPYACSQNACQQRLSRRKEDTSGFVEAWIRGVLQRDVGTKVWEQEGGHCPPFCSLVLGNAETGSGLFSNFHNRTQPQRASKLADIS
jgi:hypothetical protein